MTEYFSLIVHVNPNSFVGEDDGRILGRCDLEIYGNNRDGTPFDQTVPMHVELIEVNNDPSADKEQNAMNNDLKEAFDGIAYALGVDAFQTFTMNGKTYAPFITPFSK